MNFAIIASKKDIAGMNIVNELKKLNSTLPICIVDEETVYSDNLDTERIVLKSNSRGVQELKHTANFSPRVLDKDKLTDADFIIFASRHQSVKKVKTLTVHAIGNWKKADFGGRDNTACMASALMLKHFFQELNKQAQSAHLDKEYQISLEATHHGPFLETPCLFIEVGSSKQEWNDSRACKVVAKTILSSINSVNKIKNNKQKISIGIGGPHYCPNFNKIQLDNRNQFAISHIIAEYALPINKEMIHQAILKTKQKVEYVIIDWKGLGKSEQRQQTLDVLKDFNIKVIRTSEAKSE